MAVFAGDGNGARIRDKSIGGFGRLEVSAKMVGKLIQDDLSLLGFILTPGGLAMKHGFAVSDQGGHLIIQPDQVARGLAEAQAFGGDPGFEFAAFKS
jgi:hypothetical protein